MMKEYTQEIMSRGISVDVIGVDMGSEHALAQIVGENYRAADNPEALTKAITEVFAEVSQSGDGGKADFELLEGLDPMLAKQMIGALAKPQNHLIGEEPRPKTSLNAQSSTVASSDFNSMWIFGGLMAVVIILITVLGRHAR